MMEGVAAQPAFRPRWLREPARRDATDALGSAIGIAAALLSVIVACGDSNNAPTAVDLVQVKTLAGTPGTCDFADGTANAALFNIPSGVAVNRAGDIFVADFQNFRIRKVSQSGTVTTFAGSEATAGRSINGAGAAAGFAYPSALVFDAADNLYVFDHCAVRRVDPAAQVTTLAGSVGPDGTVACGNVDSTVGAEARFDDGGYGGGIAADANGNLYVADYANAAIRKVAPSGAVSTLAGGAGSGYADGTGSAAKFDGPAGVAVDATGLVYVADLNNNRIRTVSPAGDAMTLAGSGEAVSKDGSGTAAALFRPWGIALDSAGAIFVTENRGNRIRKLTAQGDVMTFAGAGFSGTKDGPLLTATFFSPGQLAFAPTGNLYVVDQASCVLRAATP